MLNLYKILTTILYPFLILFIYYRKLRNKEHSTRFKEKIYPSHFNVIKNNQAKLLWFHAASIGELNSILPILEEVHLNHKKFEFLITTTTLSAAYLAKKEFKKFDNVKHRFIPLDVNFLILKFLDMWKPNAVFLVDSEIWPNLIQQIHRKKIPLVLLNARITSKTFNKWDFFSKTAKEVFSLINLCLTSNLETKEYLQKFNVKNIFYHGNIKLLSRVNKKEIKNLNDNFLNENKFWFAASTHQGEEELCLKTHFNLKKRLNKIVTIIAPRHIVRTKEIELLCNKFNLSSQILNENEIIQNDREIIIINSFGFLNNFFKYAKSVFIGKSTLKKLKKVGGQNPIDAAKLGCKIYHGPYIYNFKEIYEILKLNNISIKINNADDLSMYLLKDLENDHIKNNVISNFIDDLCKKTFSGTMNEINKFILNEVK